MVAAARPAFDSGIWSALDGADRAAVLLEFADLLMENQQRLGQLESATHGTPLKYASRLTRGCWPFNVGPPGRRFLSLPPCSKLAALNSYTYSNYYRPSLDPSIPLCQDSCRL